ncbi:MAG: metalloregulator ArsR/SmtB family transcription factor [Planctomycetota bacterium]
MKRTITPIPTLQRLADLADATRARLARLAEAEELSVGELAKTLQLPQSTVSRHLRILVEGGWLSRRNEGPSTRYRLLHDELDPTARELWVTVRDDLDAEGLFDDDRRRLAAVLAERPVDSREYFGRVAGTWDDIRRSLFGDGFMTAGLLSLIPSDWTIADLGCGTGDAAAHLAPIASEVFAIDQSPEMLAAAKKRLGNVDNVSFHETDLTALDLADGSVDAAISVLVLHHIPDIRPVFAEAHRILKPKRDSVLAIIDMVPHRRSEYRERMSHVHLGFGEEEIASALIDAGFHTPIYRTLPDRADATGPGLFVATARPKP